MATLLISPGQEVDNLIPVGLTNRPELGASQAMVQATLVRLKQEKMRPLIPSLVLQGLQQAVSGDLGWRFGRPDGIAQAAPARARGDGAAQGRSANRTAGGDILGG